MRITCVVESLPPLTPMMQSYSVPSRRPVAVEHRVELGAAARPSRPRRGPRSGGTRCTRPRRRRRCRAWSRGSGSAGSRRCCACCPVAVPERTGVSSAVMPSLSAFSGRVLRPAAPSEEPAPRCARARPGRARRSRKGTGSKASGPSTPAPAHVPAASSSSATTGLIAVCHTTACASWRAMVSRVVGQVVEVHLAGRPSIPVPVTQVPAQVRPCMRSPSVAGSGSTAATTSRGETSTPRTVTGVVDDRPVLASTCEHLDELVAEPVLERHALGSRPTAGSAAPLRARRARTRPGRCPRGTRTSPAPRTARSVKNPRSRSHTSGGFRHSSMVVQIENVGAKS